MIYGILYQSSGLGNQLHRIIATKVLALDKGYEWGMEYISNDLAKVVGFKVSSFVNLDIFFFRHRLVLIQIFHDVPVYTVCVLLCMKTSRHYAAVCAFADVSCTLCKKIRF